MTTVASQTVSQEVHRVVSFTSLEGPYLIRHYLEKEIADFFCKALWPFIITLQLE